MTAALAVLAVAASYVVGSIPFGFLTAKWVAGVDIRTVGSKNPGATNVGRVLGFRFFVLVMVLDLLKGLVPTLYVPVAIERLGGEAVPGLAVLVALATILGHNFSVFLKFKGGKGVATSLGALLALDPIASLSAAIGFVIVLLVTKYVSVSSILGGTCFVVVHFATADDPIGRSGIAMTLLIAVLYVMLIVRHRSNLKRIWDGTEPQVRFGRRRPEGQLRLVALAVLGAAGLVGLGVAWLLEHAGSRPTLRIGGVELVDAARFRTGHQRAGDVTFFDGGRRLAVACPRFNRVVLFEVSVDGSAEPIGELDLDGRPVAVRASSDRLIVLQRPIGDAHHLEEGYWEEFDFDGRPLGSKFRVGWDPDDLALGDDGRLAIVLTSGDAEGEEGRPDPALSVVALGDRTEAHRVVGRLDFDGPEDDPEQVVLSDSGHAAAVVLAGASEVAGVDLSDPSSPAVTGRVPFAIREVSTLSTAGGGDEILMPVDSERRTVVVPGLAGCPDPVLITTLPDRSALEAVDGRERRAIGRLPLTGTLNLGSIRPTGLAYSPERAMLAVADRNGGVRIIAIRPAAAGAGRGGPRQLARRGEAGSADSSPGR